MSTLEWGPQGRWLVSGSWDGTARVWDLSDLDTPGATLVRAAEEAYGLSLGGALGGG